MFLPLVLLGLSAAGCGLDTKGGLDVDLIPEGSGGSGGAAGAGSGGEGGTGGSGGASGSAGTGGNAGQVGMGGTAGSAGLGGQGGGNAGAGGSSGMGGTAGTGGSGGKAGESGAGGVSGGKGGSAGLGGTGGAGGVNPDAYIPQALRPSANQILPPTRGYLLWKDGPIPAGLTIAGYDVCSTTDPMTAIDGANECPNMVTVAERYHVLDSLSAGASYLWKVRTHFSDASMSSYGPVGSFTTDHSLAGWWKMNGNADDASELGHAGSLQSEASFVSGLINQSLSLDGVDDSMIVPSAKEYNFGSGDFTLSAWIRPAREGAAETIIAKRTASNGFALYRTAGNKLAFYSSGCGIAVTDGVLPTDKWHRISAVRSSGIVTLFIDDTPLSSAACTDTFNNEAALAFGCDGPDLGCAEPFQGLIDDVTVRKTASDKTVLVNAYCADQALLAGGVDLLPSSCQ